MGRRALPGVDGDSPSCWITTLAWNEFPARRPPPHTHPLQGQWGQSLGLRWGRAGVPGPPWGGGPSGKAEGVCRSPLTSRRPPGVFSAGSLQAQRPAAAPTHRLSRRKETGSRLERKAVSGLIRELRRGAAEDPGLRDSAGGQGRRKLSPLFVTLLREKLTRH